MDSDGLNQSRALGYNQIMDLDGMPDRDKYLDPDLQWRWADESYRKQYNDLLKKSLRYKVAANFCLGAMLLNRIVSFVDLPAITARDCSRASVSTRITTLKPAPPDSPSRRNSERTQAQRGARCPPGAKPREHG